MQNIPSHNKEIRMLFKAGTRKFDVEISDTNFYTIPKEREVLTKLGWKSALDLVIGDELEASDDTLDVVKNVVISDKHVIIYV